MWRALAGRAVSRLRLSGEEGGGDGPAALLAPPVLAGRDPFQRRLDLGQCLPFGHRLPGELPGAACGRSPASRRTGRHSLRRVVVGEGQRGHPLQPVPPARLEQRSPLGQATWPGVDRPPARIRRTCRPAMKARRNAADRCLNDRRTGHLAPSGLPASRPCRSRQAHSPQDSARSCGSAEGRRAGASKLTPPATGVFPAITAFASFPVHSAARYRCPQDALGRRPDAIFLALRCSGAAALPTGKGNLRTAIPDGRYPRGQLGQTL